MKSKSKTAESVVKGYLSFTRPGHPKLIKLCSNKKVNAAKHAAMTILQKTKCGNSAHNRWCADVLPYEAQIRPNSFLLIHLYYYNLNH